MYEKITYRTHLANLHEIRFRGRFGKKGEKRRKKEKPTPEQMARTNQRNREKKVWLKMCGNFREGDYWATLKFPRHTKMGYPQTLDLLQGFLRRMRGRYKTRGHPFKYIWRIEFSRRGCPHIHILINRIPDADRLLRECWREGGVNITLAYEEGGFKKLAAYVVKPPDTVQDPEGETKHYDCSRNLVLPEPEVHPYKRRTMERLIREGIDPTPGYYIDPESVWYGINPFTGYTYLKYIEYKLEVKKQNGNRDLHNNDPGAPPGGRVMVLPPGGPPEWWD